MILPWLEPNKEISNTLKINVPQPFFDHARLTPSDQPDSGFPTVKPHNESNSCLLFGRIYFFIILLFTFFKYVVPRVQIPNFLITRHRIPAESNYENTEVEELIATLRETENLEEQGDILQYLVDTQGLDFNTGKFYWDFKFKTMNLQ